VTRPGRGRPSHAPTDETRTLVESLSGFGIPQAEIARLRREVTWLKAERDILKKASAYFAKESE